MSVDFRCKTAWDLERLQPNDLLPGPGVSGLRGAAWRGSEGDAAGGKRGAVAGQGRRASDVRRERVAIIDTSVGGGSPYDGYCRRGADVFPRSIFLVEKTENPTIVRAGQTITVNPRRGSQDKRPWRDLDLTAITQQTVETAHLFDVHLGETLVPYATLDPLKALLPIKRTDPLMAVSTDANGVGGIRIASLERRMRERWRTISNLWEQHKSSNNKLNLLGRLDYHKELSAQLKWQRDPGDRPVRVVYTKAGEPTAALLDDGRTIVDHLLYWVACKDAREAYYVVAIINSNALREAVRPLMSKGQFGARDLHKHLWKLPIPEFDPGDPLHAAISEAGRAAAEGAARELAALRQTRSKLTVTIARRELRKWLREGHEGKAVEEAVRELLS